MSEPFTVVTTPPTLDQVAETVARYFGVTPEQLWFSSRPSCYRARGYAGLLAHQFKTAGTTELAFRAGVSADAIGLLIDNTQLDLRESGSVALEIDFLRSILRLKAARPWYGPRLDRIVGGLRQHLLPPVSS